MSVNQSTSGPNQTFSPIQPPQISGAFCGASDTIFDLTFEEWNRIEEKIVPSVGFFIYREGIENNFTSPSLPEFSYTESQGLKKWMHSLTVPRHMVSFIFGYRQPREDKPEDYQRLSVCYRDIFSLMKRATRLMLSSLGEHFAFLSALKQKVTINDSKQQGIYCLQTKIYNATLEEWNSVYKNSVLFAKWIAADISRPKERLSMRRCADCDQIELPLLSPRASDSLEKWGQIVGSKQKLDEIVWTKKNPCYFRGIQKMNQILSIFIDIVDARLRFFADRQFDEDQVVADQMFPRAKVDTQGPQHLNRGINFCPLTKRSLETCLQEKETLQAHLKRFNQDEASNKKSRVAFEIKLAVTESQLDLCKTQLDMCDRKFNYQQRSTKRCQAALDLCKALQIAHKARLEQGNKEHRKVVEKEGKCEQALHDLRVDLVQANKNAGRYKVDFEIYRREVEDERKMQRACRDELATFEKQISACESNKEKASEACKRAINEVMEYKARLIRCNADKIAALKSCANITKIAREEDDCKEELDATKIKGLELEKKWWTAKTDSIDLQADLDMCKRNFERLYVQFKGSNDDVNRCILTQQLLQRYKKDAEEQVKQCEKSKAIESARYQREMEAGDEKANQANENTTSEKTIDEIKKELEIWRKVSLASVSNLKENAEECEKQAESFEKKLREANEKERYNQRIIMELTQEVQQWRSASEESVSNLNNVYTEMDELEKRLNESKIELEQMKQKLKGSKELCLAGKEND